MEMAAINFNFTKSGKSLALIAKSNKQGTT